MPVLVLEAEQAFHLTSLGADLVFTGDGEVR